TPREQVPRTGAGQVPARALGDDRVEPFFRQVLIELVRLHVDHTRMTLITNNREPGGRPDETCWIAAVAPDDRLAGFALPGALLDDELLHQLWIARQGIAEQLLADPQAKRHDVAWNRNERRGLDPHVVCQSRHTQ